MSIFTVSPLGVAWVVIGTAEATAAARSPFLRKSLRLVYFSFMAWRLEVPQTGNVKADQVLTFEEVKAVVRNILLWKDPLVGAEDNLECM